MKGLFYGKYGMLHFPWVLVFSFAGIAALVFLIVAAIQPYESWRCRVWGETTGYETQYRYFDRCYANVYGEWIDDREYYARRTARDAGEAVGEALR